MLDLLLALMGGKLRISNPADRLTAFLAAAVTAAFKAAASKSRLPAKRDFKSRPPAALPKPLEFKSRGDARIRGWFPRRLSRPPLSANHRVQFGSRPTASEPGPMRVQVARPGSRPLREAPEFKSGGSEQISSLSPPGRLSGPLLLRGLKSAEGNPEFRSGGRCRRSGPVLPDGFQGRLPPQAKRIQVSDPEGWSAAF